VIYPKITEHRNELTFIGLLKFTIIVSSELENLMSGYAFRQAIIRSNTLLLHSIIPKSNFEVLPMGQSHNGGSIRFVEQLKQYVSLF